jgi:hypothetical protein
VSEGIGGFVESPGVFAGGRGRLSLGLVLTIVVVAFEGLAVATIMPVAALALKGLALCMLGALAGSCSAVLSAR